MDERNILLVEDGVRIADILPVGLTENGCEIEVPYDGSLGYKLFESRPFNLVILDIDLPVFSRYGLCKMLRASNTDVPVIMIIALSSLENKIESYYAGQMIILLSHLSLESY
jgi:two-component system copper resistance phosphate regulon response regulator CusR